ncbi:hypothetical protein CHD54_21950 [Salmonella enterica]|nr:hypothetical protein CHD54_21950 [Salmonella enterica]
MFILCISAAVPVDFIKIDQIFVHKIGIDENTEFIISNIISLGRKLKLKFIAEGVETFEQADYLKTLVFIISRVMFLGDLYQLMNL